MGQLACTCESEGFMQGRLGSPHLPDSLVCDTSLSSVDTPTFSCCFTSGFSMISKLIYEFWNSRYPLKFNPSQLWDHPSPQC